MIIWKPQSARARLAIPALAALTLIFAPAVSGAAESASPWVDHSLSKVRLIAGGIEKGVWQAGVEISLRGEAHTYWRNPGDGGVPPVFDFSGSKNVKSVQVVYPAPMRSGERGAQFIGYKGEVIFPLIVEPVNAGSPVSLRLYLNYAACEKICTPAEAKLSLDLDPRSDGGALKARIADYQARAPKSLDAMGAPKLHISRAPGQARWLVAVNPKPAPGSDLFVEAPDGWFFDSQRLDDGMFELVQAEKPSDAGGTLPPLTLTLTTDKGAFEGVRHLDGERAKP